VACQAAASPATRRLLDSALLALHQPLPQVPSPQPDIGGGSAEHEQRTPRAGATDPRGAAPGPAAAARPMPLPPLSIEFIAAEVSAAATDVAAAVAAKKAFTAEQEAAEEKGRQVAEALRVTEEAKKALVACRARRSRWRGRSRRRRKRWSR
jgi:hypothetical protein